MRTWRQLQVLVSFVVSGNPSIRVGVDGGQMKNEWGSVSAGVSGHSRRSSVCVCKHHKWPVYPGLISPGPGLSVIFELVLFTFRIITDKILSSFVIPLYKGAYENMPTLHCSSSCAGAQFYVCFILLISLLTHCILSSPRLYV